MGISLSDYKKIKDRLSGSRKTSAVHKGNKKSDLQQEYDQAVQTLRNLQSLCSKHLFTGDVAIKVSSSKRCRGDTDNSLVKNILDSLSKVLYQDDRQVRGQLCFDSDIFKGQGFK